MLSYKLIGFLLIAMGAVITYGATGFVTKYKWDQSANCDFSNELSEEELAQYKFNKTVVNLKIFGMLTMFPGVIFVYYAFK